MSDLEVIRYRPDPGEYAWTFGGAAPVRAITPPAVLDLFTEDCFAGRVRSSADRLRPAARGRLPHRPARPGDLGGAALPA